MARMPGRAQIGGLQDGQEGILAPPQMVATCNALPAMDLKTALEVVVSQELKGEQSQGDVL